MLPRAAAFWLVAGVLVLLFSAAAAPSPLYGVYQAQWRFSATTLTAIFAAYALLLLVTLLVFGSASDYLGRRRVILAGLAMGAGACGLFLAADGAGLLFAARALQGAAVGTATSALGAALIDLQPAGSRRAPVITTAAALLGLAAGGLGASALVQYGPAPTHLVWWLLLGASVAAAAAVLAMPETAPAAGCAGLAAAAGGRAAAGAADFRDSAAVPDRGVDDQRVLPVPGAVAGRAGAPLAGPAVGRPGDLPARRDRGRGLGRVPRRQRARGHAGRLPGPARRRRGDPRRDRGDVGCRLPGRHRGGRRGLRNGDAGRLPHRQRPGGARPAASLVAAYFIASYVAFSIPVVIAGIAITHFGLHRIAVVYCAVIAVLATVAAASLIFRRRSTLAPLAAAPRAGPSAPASDTQGQ